MRAHRTAFPAPVCILCDRPEEGRLVFTVAGEGVAVVSVCHHHFEAAKEPDVRDRIFTVAFSVLEGRVA